MPEAGRIFVKQPDINLFLYPGGGGEYLNGIQGIIYRDRPLRFDGDQLAELCTP